MPFSLKIKEEVKYKSRYMCVFCKQLGPLDVHHVISQCENGSDDIDNAVCLCPTHHRQYGDNPAFYEYLSNERDKWYVYCEKFLHDADDIKNRFDSLEKRYSEIQGQIKKEEELKVDVLRKIMMKTYDTIISNLNEEKKKLEKKNLTLADIASISVAASSATATSGTINAIAASSISPEIKSSAPYSSLSICPNCKHVILEDLVECPFCKYGFKDKYFPR
jgi:hypothetical protein